MFTPKRWRKRRECEIEIILEQPTFLSVRGFINNPKKLQRIMSELTCDDLIARSDELDYETEMKEERAENRVGNMKSHKANLYGKCI